MKNLLKEEIEHMKHLFNYGKKVVISEGQSEAEKRVQRAYQIMHDGFAIAGTDPKKLRQGVDLINNPDEFMRLNQLFKDDGGTGYSSFDEMINGELEYTYFGNNTGTLNYITRKLTSIGVGWKYENPQKKQGLIIVNPVARQTPLSDPAPAAAPPAAPPKKTRDESIDGWDKLKEYYKRKQNADSFDKEVANKILEVIKVIENDRTYFLYNSGAVTGKDDGYRGMWTWDGSKPVFNFVGTKRKEVSGYISDEDTDWSAIHTDKKIMNIGASGPLVKKVQKDLINRGYAEGLNITADMEGCGADENKCDGIFGKKTKKAVSNLQKDLELRDKSGVVGYETWQAASFTE